MRSWQLLALLAAVQFAPAYFRYRWDVWGSLLGLTLAIVVWSIRGKRFTTMWWVCLYGTIEGLQIFACQAANIFYKVKTDQWEGTCDRITGLPFYTMGLMGAAALAALWLDRNKSRT